MVDDKTHIATWDLLCRLVGRPNFLYVADCKLASTENMAYIHQNQGRFLTVLPRTRSEDKAFRDLLVKGQVVWRHIHDKRNDKGEIVDQYSVCEPTTLTPRAIAWRGITARARPNRMPIHANSKSSGPRTNWRSCARSSCPPARAIAKKRRSWRRSKKSCGIAASRAGSSRRSRRKPGKVPSGRTGRPNENTRYVKETTSRFKLEYRLDREQIALEACCDGVFPLVTNDNTLPELEMLLAYKSQPSRTLFAHEDGL